MGKKLDLTGDEAIPTTPEDMAQKMDAMMAMILDLFHKVHTSDAQTKGGLLHSYSTNLEWVIPQFTYTLKLLNFS